MYDSALHGLRFDGLWCKEGCARSSKGCPSYLRLLPRMQQPQQYFFIDKFHAVTKMVDTTLASTVVGGFSGSCMRVALIAAILSDVVAFPTTVLSCVSWHAVWTNLTPLPPPLPHPSPSSVPPRVRTCDPCSPHRPMVSPGEPARALDRWSCRTQERQACGECDERSKRRRQDGWTR